MALSPGDAHEREGLRGHRRGRRRCRPLHEIALRIRHQGRLVVVADALERLGGAGHGRHLRRAAELSPWLDRGRRRAAT